jgi:hypothetical protein
VESDVSDVRMGALDAVIGSPSISESPKVGSLAMRSSASEAIGFQFSSMAMGCSGKEEGVLGAVYRGEEEISESLVLILYLAKVVDAHMYNSQSSGGRVFYCKGNFAVLRKSLRFSKGGSKVYIRRA